MAQLTQSEFVELAEELVARHGLGPLQAKLARTNLVVSRRRISNPESIARALHSLTAGLAREGLATQIVLALWEEVLAGKVDEEGAKRLEEMATKINACLDESFEPLPDKEAELRETLDEYRTQLGEKVGARVARLTMLSRAVPSVARLIRAGASANEAAS